jgi:alkylhydroperoxidase family enzyme
MVQEGGAKLTAARIPLLPEERWTAEVRDIFTIFEGEEARERGSQFNIMKTLVHHPSLMARFLAYEHQLLRHPTIPERIREIIVLRLAWLYRQDYEWKQHVTIARSIGMSQEEIEAARLGADQPVWSPLDRCVLRATEQMYAGVTVDDVTWAGLAAAFDHSQMIELLFTIGTFAMMSWIFNSTGLQIEGGEANDQDGIEINRA